ncbi:DUF814 domain-containing protein [Myxococcota bacterium]|nr:DUF814 domain-containing protein [Myxococcota bacterium]MBU1537802.1 DUF814 domain-containing protein [Myxococcota bacterium]
MNVKYFRSPQGLIIMVGMDDRSNDQLSLRVADQNDLWFHVSGFPGSHVILRCGGLEPDKLSIQTAAELAAWFSKMRKGGTVSVSCCHAKNVSKPPKAHPGTVSIKKEKNIKVRPTLHPEISPPTED